MTKPDDILVDCVLPRVLLAEGFEEYFYDDATGRAPVKTWKGTLTIGHGITHLSEDESEVVVRMKLEKRERELATRLGWGLWEFEWRATVLEMSYQLGVDGVCKFRGMIEALRRGDVKMAAWNILNNHRANGAHVPSRLYEQDPRRAKRYAEQLLGRAL